MSSGNVKINEVAMQMKRCDLPPEAYMSNIVSYRWMIVKTWFADTAARRTRTIPPLLVAPATTLRASSSRWP